AALLGNSNGNLKLLMNDGLISRNLMEIVGLNVGNYIVGQIFGHVCRCTWREGFTPPGIDGVTLFIYSQRHALTSQVAAEGHLS
ncbi:hypothetical protein MJM43_32285, partial [Salmonella enterica subsp. enterica serovar Montevideo]|nr:hypothetical protein [Salmonella enterica subsp. enterica serovar Montevideo]